AGIAAAKPEALTWLFRRRQADVYRFALHMSGSPGTADDVTQDVFLVVMREAARYQAGRSSVIPWLGGVPRNCGREGLERDARCDSLDSGADDDQALPAIGPDPLGEISRLERIGMLRR